MSYDIKDLVWEEHKNAERQEFVKTLMSGNINKQLYATYLFNQLKCYSVLEKYALANSLFLDLPGIERAPHLHYDYEALWTNEYEKPPVQESTEKYVKHIETIKDDAEKLYAHIYVRHMGDLSGGQMIRKKTPGPNRYYKFAGLQQQEYKTIIKEKVEAYMNVYQINVLAEARFCFESATQLFKEMRSLDALGHFN